MLQIGTSLAHERGYSARPTLGITHSVGLVMKFRLESALRQRWTLSVRFSQGPWRWTAERSVRVRPQSPRHSLRASQFGRAESERRADPFLAWAGEPS